jgi:hypothetical protein
MTRYQLAKLVDWAGTLRNRKRLQKVVFLLQASGCPFDAEYTLHHYGPYSQEVARLSDEMVQTQLLKEESQPNQVGLQYSYHLTDHAKASLAALEATLEGKQMVAPLIPFEQRARELLGTDLWELEVASTLVYFRQQGHDWQDSVERTCKFKNLNAEAHRVFLKKVEELAHHFID